MGAENTDINVTLEAWAQIVLDIWLERIEQLGIGLTWQLADSLEQHVKMEAGNDIGRVEFAFRYYGKFVDMGVGNGVKMSDIIDQYTRSWQKRRVFTGNTTHTTRRPKPWFTKVLWGQTSRLTELLAQKYGRKGVLTIVENVDDNAAYWEKSWKLRKV